jgi:hypothetical protein
MSTNAQIAWHLAKSRQVERARKVLPGLQLSRTGLHFTTYILRYSVDLDEYMHLPAFEDAVVLGRLHGTPAQPAVDMDDALLDEQLAAWRERRRLALPQQYRPDGRTPWTQLEVGRKAEDKIRRARRAPKGFGQGKFGDA